MLSGGPEQKAAMCPLEEMLVLGKTPVLDELPSDVRCTAGGREFKVREPTI